jgi:hypothetical protein
MKEHGALDRVINTEELRKGQIAELYNIEANLKLINEWMPELKPEAQKFVSDMFEDSDLSKLKIKIIGDLKNTDKETLAAFKMEQEGFEQAGNNFSPKMEAALTKLGRLQPNAIMTGTSQSGVMKKFGYDLFETSNPRGKRVHKQSVEEGATNRIIEISTDINLVMDKVFERLAKLPKVEGDKYAGKKLWNEFNPKLRKELFDVDIHNYLAKKQVGEDVSNISSEVKEIGDVFAKWHLEMGKSEAKLKIEGVLDESDLSIETAPPRVWSEDKLAYHESIHKEEGIFDLIKGAIESAQPQLIGKKGKGGKKDFSEPFARGVTTQLMNKKNGDTKTLQILESLTNGDFSNLEKILLKEKSNLGLKLDSEEITAMVDSMKAKVSKDKQEGRTRKRMMLDENFEIELPTGKLSIKDLLETNHEIIMQTHIKQHSYRYGAAKNGILDLDNYFDKASDNLRIVSAARGVLNTDTFKHGQALIEATRREYKGQQHFDLQTVPQQIMRIIRNLNVITRLGRLYASMSMEGSKMATTLGVRNILRNVPAAFELSTLFRDNTYSAHLKNQKARDLNAIIGNTQLQKQLLSVIGNDDNISSLSGKNTKLDSINKGVDVVGKWMNKLNNAFDTRLRLINGMAALDQIAQYTFNPAKQAKLRKARLSDEVFEVLGFSKEDFDKISEGMKKYGLKDERYNDVIQGVEVTTWKQNDIESYELLQIWLKKVENNNLIQKRFSNLPNLQTNPLYKTTAQFKDFTIASMQKEINFYGRTPKILMAQYLTYNMAIGMSVYSALTYENSLGRDDQDEYLRKRLTLENMTLAAISKMGPTGLFTSAADTAIALAGGKPMFDYRYSGYGSDFFTGIPSVSTIDGVTKLSNLISSQLSVGDTMGRQDVTDAVSVVMPNHPFLNSLKHWTTNKLYEGQKD